jgi:hypothetical protein
LIYFEIGYLDFMEQTPWGKSRKVKKIMQHSLDKIRTYEVMCVVILLVLLPSWGVLGSEISDTEMHSELVFYGAYPESEDPVVFSIGPSYNINKIREEMRERPEIPQKIDQIVDIDELTRFPGRLAVYRLQGNRIIITYSYLAPFPVIKAYGFLMDDTNGGWRILYHNEQTFVFPMVPAGTGSVANL